MRTATILLPALPRCVASDEVAQGMLARAFARGDVAAPASPGREAAVRGTFAWLGRGLPTAALTREADVGDAAGAAWLRADPAHVRADMTTARMLACGALGLTDEETEAIARELKPLFGDSGLLFDTPRGDRWYLRALPGSELVDAADPDEAIGDDLKLHLPAGAAGKRWRVLFNEVQVVLHNHPANAARARRGAVAVNALWFWGAGSLPEGVRGDVARVVTPDPALATLARLAGAGVVDGDPARAFEDAGEGRVLVDLATSRGVALEQALQALAQRLDAGRLDTLDLVFESGERVQLSRAHRWRIWRRVTPLRA